MRMRSSLRRLACAIAITFGFTFALGVGTAPTDGNTAPPAVDPAEEPVTGSLEARYSQAVAQIQAGRFQDGIDILLAVVGDDPRHADAYTYLGFAHRQLAAYDEALAYYEEALAIDPTHLGAIEYRGQTYLALGDRPAAEAHRDRLAALCPSGCDELRSLSRAIADNEPSY